MTVTVIITQERLDRFSDPRLDGGSGIMCIPDFTAT